MAAIDAENDFIQKGQWTRPVALLSPTSIYIAPVPAIVQSSPQKAPQRRFNPNDLPQLRFGEDLEEWISVMDHMVTSFGEQTTCPHILPRCFVQGDPIRDWYLTKPDEVHTFVTTDIGCWGRFKTPLRARFKPYLGVLQFETDDYRRKPGESWAEFGIKKYRLLKRAYDGATEANIVLKIKATMDTEVIRSCREKDNIDLFIGELMDFDRTSPVSSRKLRRYTGGQEPGDFRTKPVFPQYSMMNSRYDASLPQNSQAQSSRPIDKGKGTDRSSVNR
jgi:hypothetical protein